MGRQPEGQVSPVLRRDQRELGLRARVRDELDGHHEVRVQLTDKDLNAVVGFRHFSIPVAYTDDIWAKYKLGEFAQVTDPATKAPATRNIFYNSKEGDLMFPEMAVNKLQPRGVTFVVCNLAHTVLSGMLGQKVGDDRGGGEGGVGERAHPGLHPRPVRCTRRAPRAGKGEVHVLLRWIGNVREAGDGRRERGKRKPRERRSSSRFPHPVSHFPEYRVLVRMSTIRQRSRCAPRRSAPPNAAGARRPVRLEPHRHPVAR